MPLGTLLSLTDAPAGLACVTISALAALPGEAECSGSPVSSFPQAAFLSVARFLLELAGSICCVTCICFLIVIWEARVDSSTADGPPYVQGVYDVFKTADADKRL